MSLHVDNCHELSFLKMYDLMLIFCFRYSILKFILYFSYLSCVLYKPWHTMSVPRWLLSMILDAEIMGHDLFRGGKGVVVMTEGGPFSFIMSYWWETPAVHCSTLDPAMSIVTSYVNDVITS